MMLSLLLACTAPAVVQDAPDTAPSDTASAPYETSDRIESIEGSANEGLCDVTLSCAAEIVDEPKVGCAISVTRADGRVLYDGRAGVDLRGRSSAAFPKPQYAVELWDDSDEAISADLMGMGGESDWILNGAYIDRVLFRNPLAFDSFQAARPENYGPQIAHCTLTLNEEWVGIYLLTERIKRDDDRVALAPDDSGESFIVKLDDEEGLITNIAGYGIWQLVYPREVDISQSAEAAVTAWIAGWQNAVVHDPAAIPDYLNVDSMIDFILIQELTRNNDAYYLSIYLSRAPSEPMRMIPWDFDLTLGQPSYNDNENPAGFIAYRPEFIAVMSEVPGFSDALTARWRSLRAGAWSDAALSARMDGYRQTMGDVVYDNFTVWPIEEIEFGWDGKDYLYEIESYDAEHERVRAWLPQRLAWLDDNIEDW